MSEHYRPDLYAVLEAIARGIDTRDKISEYLGLQREKVGEILASLEASGLIARTSRGFIIRREAYTLTSHGWRKLDEWRERARIDLENADKLREAGREEEAIEILQPYLLFLPFLLSLEHLSILGIHDLLASEQSHEEQLDVDAESYAEDLEGFEGL